MTTDAQLAPTDDEIHAVVQACRERGLREFDVFRAVLAKWGTQPQPGAVYAELPEPDFGPGRYLGKATGDAYTKEQLRDFADRTHAARLRCKSEQARLATLWGYVRADAAPKAAPATQQAGEREQERIAFKDAHRHLDLDEVPDAWGRPMFKHSHVEASWLGWIARASHGQAPPPECETEAEKRAFAFGWFKALESERMKADNKKKDPL